MKTYLIFLTVFLSFEVAHPSAAKTETSNVTANSAEYAIGILPSINFLLNLLSHAESIEEKNYAVREVYRFARLYRRWSNIQPESIPALKYMIDFSNQNVRDWSINTVEDLPIGYDLGERDSRMQYSSRLGRDMWNVTPFGEGELAPRSTYEQFGFASDFSSIRSGYDNKFSLDSKYPEIMAQLNTLSASLEAEAAHLLGSSDAISNNPFFLKAFEFCARYFGSTLFFRTTSYEYITYDGDMRRRNIYGAGEPKVIFAKNLRSYLARVILARKSLAALDVPLYRKDLVLQRIDHVLHTVSNLDLSQVENFRIFFPLIRQGNATLAPLNVIESTVIGVWQDLVKRLDPVTVIPKSSDTLDTRNNCGALLL